MANLKNRLHIELWLVNTLRKKIIAISVIIAFLVAFYVQLIAVTYAAELSIEAWTDKTQYAPGEKGKLKISIHNGLDRPVDINKINITYPWLTYNAQTSEWEGNETISGEPLETVSSNGGDYYTEVGFEVPNDGRATGLSTTRVRLHVETSEGEGDFYADIAVMGTTLNMAIADWNQWMTIGIATIVICTIILAAVVFLSTRSPRITTVAPRAKA